MAGKGNEMYQAIFFDLDGTLLPMDQEVFTKAYFAKLSEKLAVTGKTAGELIPAVWAGVKQMVKNDGKRTNEAVFWETFIQLTGLSEEVVRPLCEDFYKVDFHAVRPVTGENPLAVRAVAAARAICPNVVLASNPLFPLDGQLTRMSWVGLSAKDFTAITSYETDSFCKPNPAYYQALCKRLGVDPKDCLMIGNDEAEDMAAATAAGLSCYLVTDCRIPSEAHPWKGAQGSFAELTDALEHGFATK